MRYLLLLLLPCFAQAQDTLDVPRTYYDSISPKNFKATWPTRGEFSTLTGTVNTINGIVTVQGKSIKDLQTQVAGIQVASRPLPKVITSSAYTLTEADNNGTLSVEASCVITCPVLPAGFRCSIYRNTSGVVSFVDSGITLLSVQSSGVFMRRISGQYGDAEIEYITNSKANLKGRLTR